MMTAFAPFRLHPGTYVGGAEGQNALLVADMTLPAIVVALEAGRYSPDVAGGAISARVDLIAPVGLPDIQLHVRPESVTDDVCLKVAEALRHHHRDVERPEDVTMRAERIAARAVAEGRAPEGSVGTRVVVRCPTPWSAPIMETWGPGFGRIDVPYDPILEDMPSIGLLLVPTYETYFDMKVERRSAWILMAHSSNERGASMPDAMGALRTLAAEAAEKESEDEACATIPARKERR